MDLIKYKPIGIIKSPFKNLEGMPIQPVGACGIKGEVRINKRYVEGLEDVKEFSHIILIYHFHRCEGYSLRVKPFMDDKKHGVFATRAPKRPNPIGLSVVRVDNVEDNVIHISNVDILDGTPLLDIKPYIPQIERDEEDDLCIGWFKENHYKAVDMKSDKRFI